MNEQFLVIQASATYSTYNALYEDLRRTRAALADAMKWTPRAPIRHDHERREIRMHIGMDERCLQFMSRMSMAHEMLRMVEAELQAWVENRN